MIQDESGLGRHDVCLKSNKSLCGMVGSQRNWWLHVSAGLVEIGFKPSKNDPRLCFGNGMILILHVDDILLVRPDPKHMSRVFKQLKDLDFALAEEKQGQVAFSFLGIDVKMDGDTIKFAQHALIRKLLETTGMAECNAKTILPGSAPLGMDADGQPFQQEWRCSSVVGMVLCLAANPHPKVQFAVHQLAGFMHCPKVGHAAAAKRVCKHFQHALKANGGLTFKKSSGFQLDCHVDADFAELQARKDDQDPSCAKF